MLRPPVEPMLAQAAQSVPGPAALRAGVAYEQKLDGSPDTMKCLIGVTLRSRTVRMSSQHLLVELRQTGGCHETARLVRVRSEGGIRLQLPPQERYVARVFSTGCFGPTGTVRSGPTFGPCG